ncbi:hypothetical protein QQF64_018584 [Cirrhinus molitorella]|uniref:Uncharacterized protein n=1 Tax=Cirrhinus molitorella TaxID=172907 RepID=A0ABR3LH06_9TELE
MHPFYWVKLWPGRETLNHNTLQLAAVRWRTQRKCESGNFNRQQTKLPTSLLCFPDIHAALRELTAIVTEQKANIRALETRLKEQQTFILKELNKKNEEVSNLTLSQVEKLRKENKGETMCE